MGKLFKISSCIVVLLLFSSAIIWFGVLGQRNPLSEAQLELTTDLSFTVTDIESISIDVDRRNREVPTITVNPKEKNSIDKLLSIFKNAEPTEDHKCANLGEIRFKLSSGKEIKFAYLPGHHEEFYEFRHNRRIFRIDRQEFFDAMNKLGVDEEVLLKSKRQREREENAKAVQKKQQ